ncbi:MAG: cation:proton antiporter [Candidatus Woesearchaeota archaeon]
MSATFIQDFGILFLFIVFFSFAVKLIKQPIIVGYVLSGLFFSFIISDPSRSEQIIILSELGITFLLFLMGLEFDLKSLKYLGKDIVLATIWQSAILFAVAFGLGLAFGLGTMASVYIGILFMFSSTLLAAKWVDDKKETETLHGKIIFSTLIIQDILAIVALSFLSVAQESSLIKIIIAPITGLALLGMVFFFSKNILNRLLKVAVRFPELLFIFSLGVCFLFVEIAPLMGYSAAIGAFLAGITLANTLYKNDIYVRLKPLIIFFNMLFFVGLGFQMNVPLDLKFILLIAILCVLSLTLKPIVIYLTLKKRGYDLKTSFISGLTLAQESEFGVIIIAAGISNGLIGKEAAALAIISVIVTMVLSSYLIKYDKKIFNYFEPKMRKIDLLFKERSNPFQQDDKNSIDYNIIFFGYYNLGKEIFAKLSGMGKRILVVENDPANIKMLKNEGIDYIYNSISNPAFFERISFEKAELVVSSLIDLEENKLIIRQAKKSNSSSTVIVTAKNLRDSLELYEYEADYVIYPFYLNEQQVSVLVEDYTTDINKVINKKIRDITKLNEMHNRRAAATENYTFLDIDSFFAHISRRRAHRRAAAKEKLLNPFPLFESVTQTKTAENNIQKKVDRPQL